MNGFTGVRQGARRGIGGVADGLGCYLKGLGWVARHPGWWLFGLIPALIAFALYAAALVWLAMNAGDVADWVTPFAESWGWKDVFRQLIAVLVFGCGLLLSVVTFTAVTLTIGDPFYEKLSEKVEAEMGGLPDADDVPFWTSMSRSVRDSLITLFFLLLFTVPLFFLGFIPVIGQTIVPVLAALVSGFFLTVELTALPLERRGFRRKQRFAILRGDKSASLGFGVAVFLTFLIPFVSIAMMPAAVAGAAIMVKTRS